MPKRLIALGFLLLLCGLVLAIEGGPQPTLVVRAQDQPQADYVGATTCANCHKDLSRIHGTSAHGLALQDVSTDKSVMKADFKTGEKERTVLFPNETTARPFTADDVAFVIGSGRYVERYVFAVERGKYAVFPAEWNVTTKQWQAYTRGAADAKWPDDAAYDFTTNCAGCHTTNLNIRRARWQDTGVQCEACHGPGSIHADLADKAGSDPSTSDLKTIREAVKLTPDAQVCGQCHSQGKEPETNLPFPTKYQPGKNLLDPATFALVSPDSKDHWWPTGHAGQSNMQFNEWILSGHARSLEALKTSKDAAPECLSCHSTDAAWVNTQIAAIKSGALKGDAPVALTLDTVKFGVTCASCHNPHLDDTDKDRKAKGISFTLVTDTYSLCTTCHRATDVASTQHHPVQEMFEGKQIVKEIAGVPSPHFTDSNGPRCVSCHMGKTPVKAGDESLASHSLKPLIPPVNTDALKDVCTGCHKDTSPASMASFIASAQADTKSRLTNINNALKTKTDAPAWVKTVVDFIVGDGSYGLHNHRYTASLLDAVERQLGIAVVLSPVSPVSTRPVVNPSECGQCHQKEHNMWLASPHANASQSDNFRKEFAARGQPAYCMGCHASGYDPGTGKYAFEGVVCSTCHYTESNAKHPPAPVIINNKADDCGRCHNGAHSPTYDEWLSSAHAKARVDCVDCHTAHNNGLKQITVNDTCGNCHKDAMQDQVHMKKGGTCADCHMAIQRDATNVFVVKTGHSMNIDPGICASCHGKVHVLSGKGGDGTPTNAEAEAAKLRDDVKRLTEEAQTNWATGLVGGVLGVLVVGGLAFFILRARHVV